MSAMKHKGKLLQTSVEAERCAMLNPPTKQLAFPVLSVVSARICTRDSCRISQMYP